MITYVKNYGNSWKYKYLFMKFIHRVCHQIGLLKFQTINFKIFVFTHVNVILFTLYKICMNYNCQRGKA